MPDEVMRKVVDFALQETELSPRELAVTFTDQERYYVSESPVYCVLKAHDLITSPAFIVLKAADEFKDKTNQAKHLGISMANNPGHPSLVMHRDFERMLQRALRRTPT